MSDEHDKTVIRPAGGSGSSRGPVADPTIVTRAPIGAPEPPLRSAVGVKVGDILNNIFEVTRFIARGGMGEVFEGRNVRRASERVAIKVILPSLSADPKIREIFENEADTLEKLGHEALVRYRLFTEDPQLGIYYLVTDYIDGVTLSDVLDTIRPSPAELIGVARRLASGLRAAHKEGAIHRDMSPDNVILEGGKLERARIIDFGIAKNTEPGSKTIIGDGFAGKLSYVAPEQLGDFSRKVGPWSDVYSLGLVILAVAQGRGSDLGGSFVDAINKRRVGVDTSAAPPELRPVLDRMLQPDPDQRLQSMDEVLDALTRARSGVTPAKPPGDGGARPSPGAEATTGGKGLPKPVLIGGGGALAVALLGGLAWLAFGAGDPSPTTNMVAPTPASTGQTTIAAVGQAVQAELSRTPCAWLTLTNVGGSTNAAELAFTGVAGRPSDAEASIFRTVQGSGAKVSASDFSGVAPISPSFCAVLDGLRPIRAAAPQRLTLSQAKYEIAPLSEGENAGQIGALLVLDLNLNLLANDFALYGVEESGEISQLIGSKAQFLSLVDNEGIQIDRLPGPNQYRIRIDGVRGVGWSGFIMLTGDGGFSEALMKDYRAPNWKERFDRAAQANGWKAEMVWFKFVDEVPN